MKDTLVDLGGWLLFSPTLTHYSVTMATMGTQELAYTPMYPVVNSQPTLGACFRNMGFGDYVRLVFGTGLGATVGFVGGASALNDALLPVPI